MKKSLQKRLQQFTSSDQRLTVLTGAGISAESGIPTFRGQEGYWTIGSEEYQPQEMATYSMFIAQPEEVWKWYFYRLGVCRQAEPNAGHFAIQQLEQLLQDRFTLITQNIDGLHLSANQSIERTFQIHGNLNYLRCVHDREKRLFPIPEDLPPLAKGEELKSSHRDVIYCPKCTHLARPHVLWFDESYDEEFFRFESAMKVAQNTDLLLIVGTSGATTLPNYIVDLVIQRGKTIINVDIEKNRFSEMILATEHGYFLQGQSGEILPEIVEYMSEHLPMKT